MGRGGKGLSGRTTRKRTFFAASLRKTASYLEMMYFRLGLPCTADMQRMYRYTQTCTACRISGKFTDIAESLTAEKPNIVLIST